MIASAVERIRRSLDTCAGESTEIEVQPAAVHGRPTEMVMNAAYLVAEGTLAKFRQTIAALQEEFAAHGFNHELTGPWPPYHFVSVRQEGIAAMAQRLINRDQLALSELLDRVLNKGVVLWGDATISVAGVDLIYVGLKVLLASVDTAERLRHGARATEPVGMEVAE
jgi:gas vesicle structural protein